MILFIKSNKEKKNTIQRQNVNIRHKEFIKTNDLIEQITQSNENKTKNYKG